MQAQDFWTRTYQKNIGKMIGVCYRYVGDRTVAEDLAHEAFLKAIEKSEQYHNFGSFEAWLMRINLNNTLDYLRKQPHFQSVDDMNICDDGLETEEEPLPAADFTEQEILEAICALPDKQRAVFNLYVFEKQKHSQIAETLKIGERSSKRYLSEARTQLQAMLTNTHKRKKSLLMILLPFIPHKAHAIDRLCRTKLQHLSVAPAQSSPLAGVNWGTVPKPSAWMAISAAKVPAIATATAGIAAVAVSGTLIVLQPAAPTEQHNPLSTNEIHDSIGMVVDTVETAVDTTMAETAHATVETENIPDHPTKKTPPLSETPCPSEENIPSQSSLDAIDFNNFQILDNSGRVSQKRALEPFTSLTVSSHIDVIIARGDESTAYIAADSNVIDYVLTKFVEVIDPKTFEVLGRELTVSLKRGAPKTDSPISVTIYTPHLKEVTLKEMSSVTAREINEDTFTVINQSSGRFKCDCLVAKKELVLENNGAGTIDVQYLCYNTLTIINKGAGSITATETMVKSKTTRMNVQNLSVGYISLAVLEVCVLDLKNRGWGSISVQGRAENLIVENGCVGNIKADGLIAHSAYITHKGTGSTNVHVPKDGIVYLLDGTRLSDVKITGGGKVVTKK
ncbi:MAG: sigma-70 family RNA polymerase sigma factor [Bacteroidales bacterium]|nr:sigma-70 family RNA polymerase sigma factor [Bacteroidales bacterium]